MREAPEVPEVEMLNSGNLGRHPKVSVEPGKISRCNQLSRQAGPVGKGLKEICPTPPPQSAQSCSPGREASSEFARFPASNSTPPSLSGCSSPAKLGTLPMSGESAGECSVARWLRFRRLCALLAPVSACGGDQSKWRLIRPWSPRLSVNGGVLATPAEVEVRCRDEPVRYGVVSVRRVA